MYLPILIRQFWRRAHWLCRSCKVVLTSYRVISICTIKCNTIWHCGLLRFISHKLHPKLGGKPEAEDFGRVDAQPKIETQEGHWERRLTINWSASPTSSHKTKMRPKRPVQYSSILHTYVQYLPAIKPGSTAVLPSWHSASWKKC
jgi:hypothetical protein